MRPCWEKSSPQLTGNDPKCRHHWRRRAKISADERMIKCFYAVQRCMVLTLVSILRDVTSDYGKTIDTITSERNIDSLAFFFFQTYEPFQCAI